MEAAGFELPLRSFVSSSVGLILMFCPGSTYEIKSEKLKVSYCY